MIDYNKLVAQMEQIKNMANEVITEAKKEAPDKIKIMDIACEGMDELLKEVDSTVLRQDRNI